MAGEESARASLAGRCSSGRRAPGSRYRSGSPCRSRAAAAAVAVALVVRAPARRAGTGCGARRRGRAAGARRGARCAWMRSARACSIRELGESGTAELVTVAPARSSPWSTRVIAVTRTFRHVPVRERVLLVLPVGRSPPARGTILEASVRDRRATARRRRLRRAAVARAPGDPRRPRRVELARARSSRRARRARRPASRADRERRRARNGRSPPRDRARGRARRGRRLALGRSGRLPRLRPVPPPGRIRAERRVPRRRDLRPRLAAAAVARGARALDHRRDRRVRPGRRLAAVRRPRRCRRRARVARLARRSALRPLALPRCRRARAHGVDAHVACSSLASSSRSPRSRRSSSAVPRCGVGSTATRFRARCADALAVALACGVATAPIVLFHFGEAPVYTVLANVVAFVAAPLVLGLGLLAAVVDPVSPSAAAGLACARGLGCGLARARGTRRRRTSERADRDAAGCSSPVVVLGGAWLARPAAAEAGSPGRSALPAALAARRCAFSSSATAWVTARPAPAWEPPAGLRVTFLDVGQGDAILLETPRASRSRGPRAARGGRRRAARSAWAFRSLSALVLTHPQRDHVGGAADVIRRLDVGAGARPRPRRDRTGARGGAARRASARRPGRRRSRRARPSGPAAHPARRSGRPTRATPSEDPNLNAVVLVASYGETDVFLPADAESDVTARLPLPEVEILKVAHHGSEDPGLASELRELRPRVAVISCGRDNDYGHPRPETLAALERLAGPRRLPHRRGRARGRRVRRRADAHRARPSASVPRIADAPDKPVYLITGSDRPKVETAIARLRGPLRAGGDRDRLGARHVRRRGGRRSATREASSATRGSSSSRTSTA